MTSCADAAAPLTPVSEWIGPADGATNVPTNPCVWVGSAHVNESDTVAIRPLGGFEVNGTQTHVEERRETGATRVHVFCPADPLQAGVTYEITVGGQLLSSFVTGTEDDDVPPPVPKVESRTTEEKPARVRVDLGTVEALTIARLKGDGIGNAFEAFDENRIAGVIAAATVDGVLSIEQPIEQDSAIADLPSVATDNALTFEIGSFDVSGNFSGWSSAQPLSCACSSLQAQTPFAGIALACTFFVGCARRRSKGRLQCEAS